MRYQASDQAVGSNNWLAAGFSRFKAFGTIGRSRQAPPFAAPKKNNYHLIGQDKQFIDVGLPLSKITLPATPFAKSSAQSSKKPDAKLQLWQYRHPAGGERRVVNGSPDLGAYERK